MCFTGDTACIGLGLAGRQSRIVKVDVDVDVYSLVRSSASLERPKPIIYVGTMLDHVRLGQVSLIRSRSSTLELFPRLLSVSFG